MKRFAAAGMAGVLALSLAACGGTSAPSTASTASTAASGAASAGAEAASYTVGVCQFVQHPALDAATEGFKTALTDKLGAAVTFDEKNANNDAAMTGVICNGFVAAGVDLIFANATPVLQSAAAATDSIPVLGTSVTDYATALDMDAWTGTTGRNISGTTDLAPLADQAAMLAELFPVADYKEVGILYCSAEANSKYQSDIVQAALEELGYAVTVYTFADSNDVSSVAQSAVETSKVLYIPTDNTAASNAEAIDNIAKPAGVPIIAGEEGICAGCGVATLSISYYDLGYATGEMAYEVLVNGADISAMPVQSAPAFTKKYDAERCEALGITVPSDYEAIVKES